MRKEPLIALLAKLHIQHDAVNQKGWINAPCPLAPWLHKNGSDRTPSFGVIVDDKGPSSFKCWGCKQHGTVTRLVRMLSGYRSADYEHLIEESRTAERSGRVYAAFDDIPDGETYEALDVLEEAIWDGLFEPIGRYPDAAAFMTKRRVSKRTADKLGLQFDPAKKRIIFPVRGEGGALYGFTGRSILPDSKIKVLDYAGLPKKSLILGRERWRDHLPVVIVEGLFAYARFHEIGVEDYANIGALLGSEMTSQKADILKAFGQTVILMLDPDEAGDAGTFGAWDEGQKRTLIENAAIGRLWGHVPLVVPDYPPDMDDADPDNLDLDQVRGMIRQKLFRPDPVQAKAMRGAGISW